MPNANGELPPTGLQVSLIGNSSKPGRYRKYGKNRIFEILSNFWIFALYGSWEAGDSLKIVSRGVGTFSTIEDLILRTLIFRFCLDPRSLTPKVRPALRKAGRIFLKSGSFVSKSWPDHPRRVWKLATQRKARPAFRKAGRTFQIRPPKWSATRLAQAKKQQKQGIYV